MNTRAMMYLEEYARHLSDEVASLLEQQMVDHDIDAGHDAKLLLEKINDVRHIVAVMSQREHLGEYRASMKAKTG